MAKVVFKRVENNSSVSDIPVLDGQLIYTKDGLSYIDYGEDRIPMTQNKVCSTDEKVIGQWVDGKPIYRKTFILDTLLPDTNTSKAFPHDIDNFGKLININCIVDNYSWQFDFNNYTWEENGTTNNVKVWVDITDVYIIYSGQYNLGDVNGYITLEYTKTTD
jgi:hypothetical protein